MADALSRPPSCASPAKPLSPVVRTTPPTRPGVSAAPEQAHPEVERSENPPPPSAAPPPETTCQQIDYAAVALAQPSCPDVTQMLRSTSLQVTCREHHGHQLYGDISTGVFRPLLPQQLHNVHHPGVRATVRLVSAAFCWPGLRKEVTAFARACMGCQRGKIHRHISLKPEAIAVPSRRFSHLHVDIVGPLPSSNGFTYIFTVIDRTTRWPEAIPLCNPTVQPPS